MVADELIETLGASALCTHDQLVAPRTKPRFGRLARSGRKLAG